MHDSKRLRAAAVSLPWPLLYGNPGLIAGDSVDKLVCSSRLNRIDAELSNKITPTELSGELSFRVIAMLATNSLIF